MNRTSGIFTPTVLLLALLLAGCAARGPEFSTAGVTTIHPSEAAARFEQIGPEEVLWGGTIINTVNLEGRTQLEVIAYPLGDQQKPQTGSDTLGRFLVVEEGYLEPADYGQGRLVTVKGTLAQPVPGKVGQSEYLYPVVQADEIYLWPHQERTPDSRVNFGIGVIFSN